MTSPRFEAPSIIQDAWALALDAIEARIDGELKCDPLHRALFATDASLYAEEPIGVVYPRHRHDVLEIVRVAGQFGLPLIPRAAGTSLAGQCVGNGLVVDISRHMTQILKIDVAQRTVCVQPGVILDELNRALLPHGLMFGPDTSTSNRCTIGGMIGNNSCGSHSILYGTTRDHVLEVEAVLANGEFARLGAHASAPTEADAPAKAALEQGMRELVEAHRDEILARFPRPEVVRRNMGYPLDFLARCAPLQVDGPAWNLGRFLCGSEGTLAFVTEATLNLVPVPRGRIVVAAHFDTLDAALVATTHAVEHQPAAVELIDRRTLDATRDNLEQRRNRSWLEGDPGAVLVVEFYRDHEEDLVAATVQLTEHLRSEQLGYAFPVLRGAEIGRVWELRKAGLGLLMGTKGDIKPITFVEDTAVAVADLPAYIRDFAAILERYDTRCVYYAHASVGLLHLRPELNPKDPGDISKMKGIAADVAELVRSYRGSISGEHGDGRVRSPLIAAMLGEQIVQVLGAVKHLWDPLGIFNPGKIVEPAPMDANLRFPPGRPAPQIETVFAFREDDGILGAVERCNGAGACRKLVGAGGTMCPSYMATHDEVHTTRGRANVFRTLLLEGTDPTRAFDSPELYAALDLCLSCKGCKSECPASVDMARLKAEFLQQHYDTHGTPLRALVMGRPERGYRLAQRFSGLINRGARSRVGKAVLSRVLGVDPRRDLPAFASRTLRQELARRPPRVAPKGAPEVVLFIDVFTDYNEPEIGLAAVELLEAAGFLVTTIDHPPSGRAQISKGLVREAKEMAERNVELFEPFAARGVPILGLEPSAALTLVDEVPDLVGARYLEAARAVAERVELVEVFLGQALAKGTIRLPFDSAPRRALLHGHCHQKSILGNAPLLDALRAIPALDVRAIPSGCCGMAGSFGYEKEHYDLSLAVGELVLFPTIREADEQTLVIAPGTSCRHQIRDGVGRRAYHPIEIFALCLQREEAS